jgi:uncharacterized protein
MRSARAALARVALAVALAAALLGAHGAHALEPPALERRVTDLARVLAEPERAGLEARLEAYERQTGHQFAVLVLPSLEGEILEDFSHRTAERWRLGDRERDDGLLVLLAIGERKVRIEVGDGLEGAITDALAKRVIAERMAPRLRAGDYAGGLTAGLEALMSAAQGEAVGAAPGDGAGAPAPGRGAWVVPVLFLVVLLLLSRARRGGRRRGGGIFFLPPFGGGFSVGGRHDGWWSGGGGGGFGGGGGGFGGGGASGDW